MDLSAIQLKERNLSIVRNGIRTKEVPAHCLSPELAHKKERKKKRKEKKPFAIFFHSFPLLHVRRCIYLHLFVAVQRGYGTYLCPTSILSHPPSFFFFCAYTFFFSYLHQKLTNKKKKCTIIYFQVIIITSGGRRFLHF